MKGIFELKHAIHAFISKGDRLFVAECLEIAVVTQGQTLEETISNLQEAVALHIEGEDLEEMGFAPNPSLSITMELELAHASA